MDRMGSQQTLMLPAPAKNPLEVPMEAKPAEEIEQAGKPTLPPWMRKTAKEDEHGE